MRPLVLMTEQLCRRQSPVSCKNAMSSLPAYGKRTSRQMPDCNLQHCVIRSMINRKRFIQLRYFHISHNTVTIDVQYFIIVVWYSKATTRNKWVMDRITNKVFVVCFCFFPFFFQSSRITFFYRRTVCMNNLCLVLNSKEITDGRIKENPGTRQEYDDRYQEYQKISFFFLSFPSFLH